MKKGFTLIELLAVIVVLAIVAGISVPMIINITEKTKKGALKATAGGLLDSASIYYAKNLDLDEEEKVFLFDTTRNGETETGDKISYKGSFEGTGSVRLYSDGKTAICISDGKYFALKNISDTDITVGLGTCDYDDETKSYLSIELVSKEQLDALQAELDSIKAEKQLIVDALNSKGVTSSSDDSLTTIANKVNSITIGKQVVYLGNGSSYNIKTLYPAIDYTKLTNANFIVEVTNDNVVLYIADNYNYGSWVKGKSFPRNVTKTYNATTGVITVSGISINQDILDPADQIIATLSIKVYLIY